MTQFQSEDNLSSRTRYRDLVRRIWPYIAKYKAMLIFLVTIVVIHTAIGRFLPTIIGRVVDEVIIEKKYSLLMHFCIMYLGLEILRFIFVITETYFFQVLGLKTIYDMRKNLFEHVEDLPIRFFDKNPVGRVVTRITNDFASIGELFTAGLVSVFVDSISLIAIIIAMMIINVKLTLIVLSISPLMLWSTFFLSGKARDSLRVLKKRLAAINSFISENISGMKITTLYTQEERQRKKFNNLSEDYKNLQINNIKYLAWLHPVLNGFNAFTVAMALYYGGILNEKSTIPVGLIVAFLMHVQDFLPPLRNILEKYQTFQASLASCERIFTLFDEPLDKFAGHSLEGQKIKGHIEFRNVSFAYNHENGPVLKNVSLIIQPGENIAIVGVTGSGKSTIISLLQRFYDFDSLDKGQILIDGQDIRDISKKTLRKKIGVVQQDFFLFRGSILSNITLNDPGISTETALKAAHKAHCDRLLKQRGPEGIVQEKGANLSSGEKQLLNFARILAFDPDILILDEATAHIDSQSEALIQKATREATQGRTSIIIAHRLSTIIDCDRIYVLDHGDLVESGRHQELLASHGVYHRLYLAQQKELTNQ